VLNETSVVSFWTYAESSVTEDGAFENLLVSSKEEQHTMHSVLY